MIDLTVKEILEATNGSLSRGFADQVIGGIGTDSRTIRAGHIFLALDGPNHKGTDFISQAIAKGAIGCISGKCEVGSAKSWIAIEVENPLKALHDIGHFILHKVKPKVIAITGSTGKTSVKEMLKSILSHKYEVVASKANYNNEVGLPSTLLELKPSTEVVVLEMAMRGMGQIRELCRIAPPDLAVITNVGLSHIELLKSEENIVKAKAEIIKGLKKDGVVFLNSDDGATQKLRMANGELRMRKANVVLFGSDKNADVYFDNLSVDDLARPSFDLIFEIRNSKFKIPIKLPIPGRHNVTNACAAAAIALHLKTREEDIKKGLEKLQTANGRMQVSQANGWIIVDDSYNASPASMEAALDTLKDIRSGRKVAVLGDMLELGNRSPEEHSKLGKLAANSELALLFTVGNRSEEVAKAAISAGMAKQNVHGFRDWSELNKEIISYLRFRDAILIKASRALELDKVAIFLQKKR